MTTMKMAGFLQSIAAELKTWELDDLCYEKCGIAITLFQELPVESGMTAYKPVRYRQYVRINNVMDKPVYFWTEIVGFDLKVKTNPNTWVLGYSELEKLHRTVERLRKM